MNKQVNLLPDSKQQRIREKRTRQMITSITLLVIVVAVAVPIILLGVKGTQKLQKDRLQDQIEQHKATIAGTSNISTMLTIKDHLQSLADLYNNRAIATELINYLPSVTPTGMNFTSIDLETTSNTITITGSAAKYSEVEKFYRALANSGSDIDQSKVEPDPLSAGYFTNETLQTVNGPAGETVSFTITATFDPKMIDGEKN